MKQKKSFLKVPTLIDGFNTDLARPRSTTSGEASLVWEDALTVNVGSTQGVKLPSCDRRPLIAA